MTQGSIRTQDPSCAMCSAAQGPDLVEGPGGRFICRSCLEFCDRTLRTGSPASPPVPASGLDVPFEIADFSRIPGVPCPCGTSRRAFMRADNRLVSVHVVDISKDAQAHYHKRQTETYYFLQGEGQMELDGRLFPVKPGMSVMIRPGTRHRAVVGTTPMKILNVVVPPFDVDDEWFD